MVLLLKYTYLWLEFLAVAIDGSEAGCVFLP